VVKWNAHIFVRYCMSGGAVESHLLFGGTDFETRRIGWYQDLAQGMRPSGGIRANESDDVFCNGGVGTPHLRAVDDPFITSFHRFGRHSTFQIGARARFGKSKRRELVLSARHAWQPFVFEFFASKQDDRSRTEPIVGGNR